MRDVNKTDPIDDAALAAWVDGELDAGAAAQLEVQLGTHPTAAARVARLQMLNHRLRAAFATELADTVPPALAATARGDHLQTTVHARSGRVLPWPATRPTVHGWKRWGGLAAGVLLAVWAGPLLWNAAVTEPELLTQADGRVMAQGALALSLEHSLAGDREGQPSPVRVLLSFKDRTGQFCRTFSAPAGAGLACREAGRWQVAVLAARPQAQERGLRLAGSDLPATVLDAVEHRIAGLALDASQERAARDAGWQP